MVIGVEELNRQNNNRLCEMYGLDYLEYEPFGGEEVSSTSKEFGWFNTFENHRSHMGGKLRFGKNGKHYTYLPKVHLEQRSLTTIWGTSEWYEINWKRMEREFEEIFFKEFKELQP